MRQTQKNRYEMLGRVKDFGAAHPELFPEGSMEGGALAVVGQAVAEIDAQAEARVVAAEAGRRAKAAAKAAVRAQMVVIARTARAIARLDRAFDHLFLLPGGRSDVSLLTSARVFIREGESRKEPFVRHRLPATVFSDLAARVEAFEAARRGRRASRSGRAEAQAEMVSALERGFDAARTIDAVMVNVLAGDPGLLAAWKGERRVEAARKAARVVPVTAPAPEPASKSDESLQKAS